jgi:general stress protein 26
MEPTYAITEGLALITRSKIALLGSVDKNGYPNIKAMLNLEHEDLKTIWFSTNTSSKRVAQFRQNPKACVYYVDQERFMGLMLVGILNVLQDTKSRQRLWRPGFEMYYLLGVDDPDYSVFCFTTAWANFYHGLSNLTFEV